MTYNEKFHNAFLKKGGAAIIQPTNHLYNILLITSLDIITTKKSHQINLPTPIVGFINNTTLNASATKYKDEYFIGINWGTIGILQNIVLRMLSSKRTFPWIGNSNSEGETQKIYNHQHFDYEYIKWRKGDEDISPKDKIRLFASNVILEYMVKFLIAHEYVHIINGHIDFINSLSGSKVILDETVHTNLPPIKKQTLEMDADSIAVNIFFRDWMYGSSFIGFHKVASEKFRNENTEIFTDKDFGVKLFITSMLILFRMMEPYNASPNDFKSSTHPTAYLRSHFVFETTKPYLKSRGKFDLLKIFERSFFEIRNEVVSAFNEITSGPISQFRDGKLTQDEDDHVNNIMMEWKKIRTQLRPFATHDILAP